MIAYILGNIIRIEAALLAVPAFVSIWYQEAKAASAFVATIIACLMVGTVLVSRKISGFMGERASLWLHFRGL